MGYFSSIIDEMKYEYVFINKAGLGLWSPLSLLTSMICTRGTNTMSISTSLSGEYYTNYVQYTFKFVILSALYVANVLMMLLIQLIRSNVLDKFLNIKHFHIKKG